MATEFLKRPMRVLHLEDNENDQVLVREMLQADGLTCETVAVKTGNDFEAALKSFRFDLIISDYSLPSFDGLHALAIARKLSPRTPFIFFSGTIGEEVAVESLRNGAMDYVLKQRPHRLAGAVRNALRITEERSRRERMEGELRQLEERLRIVAHASNDVVWEWDIPTGRLWFSENFQTVFGHPREEIGARLENWQQLIHPDDRHRVLSGLTSMLAVGGRVWWSEHRLRCANGSWLHVYDRASVIYDAARKPLRIVGMVIDMTDQKRAEGKIREQADLLDKAQDAIVVCDLDRAIVYWNKGAERIYGWTMKEAAGKNIRDLFFHDRQPPQLEEALKSLEERGEWAGELTEFTKKDTPVIVMSRSTLIRDEEGRPKGLLIINTDITERKQLEEKFLRAQRLESIGALVGGIAHDLNNALVPIIIGVEILEMEDLTPEARSMAGTLATSARRSAELVKQMLLFARGGESVKTVVHVDLLLKEMGKIMADTFPKNIRCRVQTDPDAWPVSGFPTRLHQVLMNLCVNARDAMPDGGTLTLSAQNVKLTRAEAARHPDAEPGNYLCLTVADSGTGIPPEVLEKLFQPFFTTKGVGKGTGLGLSTCQDIVRNHGGFIDIQTRPKAGSEFQVFLPAADRGMPEPAAETKPDLPVGHGEHVLVVDDEEGILAITRAALENFGYQVHTAASGIEAIHCFAKNSDTISLVLTDLAMPLMDGCATAKALRKIRPDLKVIIASGSEKEMDELLKRFKSDAFIAKPFTSETLLTVVHQVLSR